MSLMLYTELTMGFNRLRLHLRLSTALVHVAFALFLGAQKQIPLQD